MVLRKLGTEPTFKDWHQTIDALGYPISDAINITGWRNSQARPDYFDDFITVTLPDGALKVFKATTLPGRYWLENLMNPKGTAILQLGYYRDAYKLGFHKGKEALVQVAPVTVYRDVILNGKADLADDTVETGMFAINIHRAGFFSKYVGKWSAGCQVFQKNADFEEFLRLVKIYGKDKRFSYTLVGFAYDL